jgi:hypothetical protein
MRWKWRPNAANSYWGWGSHNSAILCRKWPEWCLRGARWAKTQTGVRLQSAVINLRNKFLYFSHIHSGKKRDQLIYFRMHHEERQQRQSLHYILCRAMFQTVY